MNFVAEGRKHGAGMLADSDLMHDLYQYAFNLQPWSQMLEKNSPTPPFNVGVEIRVHRLRSYIQH